MQQCIWGWDFRIEFTILLWRLRLNDGSKSLENNEFFYELRKKKFHRHEISFGLLSY